MNALFRGLMVSVVAVTLVASAAIGANAASEFGSFCWDVRRMTDNVRIAFLRLQVTQHSAIEFSLYGEEKVRSHSVNGSGYVDPVFGWVMGVTNTRNPTSMAMGGILMSTRGTVPDILETEQQLPMSIS